MIAAPHPTKNNTRDLGLSSTIQFESCCFVQGLLVIVMTDLRIRCGYLKNERTTLALGRAFSKVAQAGLIVYLEGDLGAGKTTFTRGLLNGLGYNGKIKSPTYTLLKSYVFPRYTVHHFDHYRFAAPEEWADAGFREYFSQDTMCVIEWPSKAADLLPSADITLDLSIDEDGRYYRLLAHSATGQSCLMRLPNLSAAPC